jgi:hypothetical protein
MFVIGRRYMQQFEKHSEHVQLRGFDWVLALLQLQSLKRVRLTEELCARLTIQTQRAGGWPTSKYTPPNMVSEAFVWAETELDFELSRVREVECEFEQ